MEEMLKIGQVAKIYGISLDTLRLYEKKGLLIPHVCADNKYRYYSINQLDTLELILNAKNAGMSLQEVKQILTSKNLSASLEMFEKQEKVLEEKIKSLQQTKEYTKQKVHVIKQIVKHQNDMAFEKKIQTVHEPITIYLMNLELLIKIGANSAQTDGMKVLETWRLFHLSKDYELCEDLEIAAFSFPSSNKKSDLEKDFLKLYDQGLICRQILSHRFMKFPFLGTNQELAQYMNSIKEKVHITQPNVYIKSCHTVIHLEEENEYFVEIYLL